MDNEVNQEAAQEVHSLMYVGVTKSGVQAVAKAVLDVLGAALEHHNPTVAVKALDALKEGLAIKSVNVSNCVFTGGQGHGITLEGVADEDDELPEYEAV